MPGFQSVRSALLEQLAVAAAVGRDDEIEVNAAMEQLLGVPASALVSRTLFLDTLCASTPEARRRLAHPTTDAHAVPVTYRSPAGDVRHLSVSRTHGDDGEVWLVEPQERARARGASGGNDIASLLANLPGMAYRALHDAHRTMQYVSDGALALTGYPPAELLDNARIAYHAVVHPDDRDRLHAEVDAALAAGRPFQITYRITTATGAERWVWEKGRGVDEVSGPAQVVEGFIQDVTQQHAAEDALAQSESRLRAFFDAPHVVFAILALTDDGNDIRYELTSRAFAARFGQTPEGMRRQTASSLGFPPDQLANFVQLFNHVWNTKAPTMLEYDTPHTAPPAWMLASASPLATLRNERPLIAFVATDITERRTVEEQLRQAQKMEAVGRLAGGVAHDFNNLLTVIGGSATFLLAEFGETNPGREDALEIKRAVDRASDLTRQLLTFSRRQVTQPRLINLSAQVRDAERMLRRLIGEDVRLRTELASDLPATYMDAGQFDQALVNLVVNARDAMPAGGELLLRTFCTSATSGERGVAATGPVASYVALEVTDTGHGIDDATRARLFEPFFTTKEPGKGTGLGLSTVFGIVTQAGGRIDVDSTPGKGATFRILLPITDDAPTVRAYIDPAVPAGGGNEVILLVEDDERVRSFVRRTLDRAGYRVMEATDSAEALVMIEESVEPIDLVITDVILPGLNGKELADRVCELRPGTRVLFMTGYTGDAVLHDAVSKHGAPVLEKPFRTDDLRRAVRLALVGR